MFSVEEKADKVLFTASTYRHIRQFHLPYLRAFYERGWHVHVACGSPPETVPYAERTVPLPFQKRITAHSNFAAARILGGLIRREHYRLLCSHTSLASFFSRLPLSGMASPPAVVTTVHGYLFDDSTPFLYKQLLIWAERLTASKTDLLLTMNQYDEQTARRLQLGGRVSRIPGIGVDFSRLAGYRRIDKDTLRRKLGLPPDAFVLHFSGEFTRRKNQEDIIRTAACLPENVVLVLSGDGPLREKCQRLSVQLNLTDRVVFPGWTDDVGQWYRAADVHLSASRSEGLPFNIMEAMYMGLPVVASAVKGHVDLLTDGQTGLLYPFGDTAACAACVLRLMQSSTLRQNLSIAASQAAMPYSLETTLPIVMNEYLSCVESQSSRNEAVHISHV